MPAVLRRFMATRLGIGVMVGLLVVILVLSQSSLLRGTTAPAPAPTQRAAQTQAAPGQASPPTGGASAPSQAAPAAQATADPSASFLSAYQDPQAEPAPNGLVTILSLLLKLAIVIALIYATVWVLRFLNGRTANTFTGHNALNVLETTRLGANREVYLLEVANKVLVVGATGANMSLLTEISDAEALEALRNRTQPALPSAEPFLNYLKGFGDKLSSHEDATTPAALASQEWQTDVSAATDGASKKDASRRPADLLQRIEQSKQRIHQSTLAIQEKGSRPAEGFDLGVNVD